MRIPSMLCCLLLLALIPALASCQSVSADSIDKVFEPWNKPDRPGCSVAVVRDGQIVFQKGYGSANLEYGIPIGPTTVFHVASVSKQFTAMALVLLEADGKLSIDDDVRKHLPELPDYGTRITIRDLLQHTSGIRDQWQTLALAGWRLDDVITQQQILRLLFRQRELNFPPRTEHLYSNGGYTLAAEIVRRVSGKSLDEFSRERIFGPLGMVHTHFHQDHDRVVPNRAYSYFVRQNTIVAAPLNYANVGATSLFSTAPDLVRWLDNFRTHKVGGPAAAARLQETAELLNGQKVPYGLGVGVGAYRGLKTISHSGGDAAYRSYVVWFPERALGVAVLSNAGHAAPPNLANRVADLYAAPAMKTEEPKPAAAERKFVELPPDALKRLAGLYRAAQGTLLIQYDGDKLRTSRLGDPPLELRPLSSTRFYALPPLNVEVEFSTEGKKRSMTVHLPGGALQAEALDLPPFDPTELSKYEGSYWSDELETQYTIAVRGGELVAGHPRHVEIVLRPVARDYFTGSAWFCNEVVFERDRKGRIIGMKVGGGRVRGVRFSRRTS